MVIAYRYISSITTALETRKHGIPPFKFDRFTSYSLCAHSLKFVFACSANIRIGFPIIIIIVVLFTFVITKKTTIEFFIRVALMSVTGTILA
jgi:hypothetical protein